MNTTASAFYVDSGLVLWKFSKPVVASIVFTDYKTAHPILTESCAVQVTVQEETKERPLIIAASRTDGAVAYEYETPKDARTIFDELCNSVRLMRPDNDRSLGMARYNLQPFFDLRRTDSHTRVYELGPDLPTSLIGHSMFILHGHRSQSSGYFLRQHVYHGSDIGTGHIEILEVFDAPKGRRRFVVNLYHAEHKSHFFWEHETFPEAQARLRSMLRPGFIRNGEYRETANMERCPWFYEDPIRDEYEERLRKLERPAAMMVN